MSAFNANLPPMRYGRAHFGMATHGRRIFVMGGYCTAGVGTGATAERTPTATAEMFDIDTQRWTTIPSMNTARHHCAAVRLGDNIVVMDRHGAEQYNVVSNQWSPLPPMNISRIEFAADVLDGKIIVVGGYDDEIIVVGGDREARVEEYDPSTGEWRELPSMRCKRMGCATAVLDGKLYVMGGCDEYIYLSSVEVYDPATHQWTLLNDMTTPRCLCAAVSLEGRIVVAGGRESIEEYLSSCEVYDPKTKKWSYITSMHSKRYGCKAVEVEGNVYVLGGHDESFQYHSSIEYLPSSALFALLLDDKPDLAKELGIDDNAMPSFLFFIGRNCRMLTLWKVIRNRQDLLNLMPVVSTHEKRAQKRARH